MRKDNEMKFAENLRKYRTERGYSQEDLAGLMGFTSQAVSKWECESSQPDLDGLVRLTEILGVSADALLGLEVEAMPQAVRVPVLDELADDNVLRVVQFRGREMLRQDTYDPEVKIPLELGEHKRADIEIWGSAEMADVDVNGDVSAGGSITCGGVNGDVSANGCVTCGGVNGSVSANGRVTCGGVDGDVNTNGSVTCGDIGGDVETNGSITCTEIHGGDIEVSGGIVCSGDIECDEIEGDVTLNGSSLECDEIEGDVTAHGCRIKCDEINGDVTLCDGSQLECEEISGDVGMNES